MTAPRVALLTPREQQIVNELLRDAPSNRQIGRRLYITENSVKTHMRRILAATGCPDRTALVLALCRGRLDIHTVRQRAQ